MPEMKETSVRRVDHTQAIELSLLVDLEARWENLRKTPAQASEVRVTLQDLTAKQKAYEDFHARLVAYNKKYTPTHVPDLLLNTPSRLGIWCRKIRDLYLQVEHVPQGHCPIYLLEKAHRWADRIGVRMSKDRVTQSTAQGTIRAVIGDLEALVQWCEDLDRAPEMRIHRAEGEP